MAWSCRYRNIIILTYFFCKLETLSANFLVGVWSQERMVWYFLCYSSLSQGLCCPFHSPPPPPPKKEKIFLVWTFFTLLSTLCARNWGLEKKADQQAWCYCTSSCARLAGIILLLPIVFYVSEYRLIGDAGNWYGGIGKHMNIDWKWVGVKMKWLAMYPLTFMWACKCTASFIFANACCSLPSFCR